MKILRDAVIDDHYDVIVIGAGIGGLTAAALLAHRGLRVLAVEQHYLPGGCCTAIRRRGIAFDVGAALLYGFGPEGYNPHRYVMNELEEDIDMIRHECVFRVNFDDRQVTLWLDFERYFKELAAAFPHEEKGLRRLYKSLWSLYKGVLASRSPAPPTEMHWVDGMRGFFRAPLQTMRVGLSLSKTTKNFLEQYVSDRDLIGFFDMLMATMFCCTTEELPLLLGSIIMVDTHVGGACYPAGSPQMLPNKLEKALEKNGGRILYRHLVEEILIHDGAATGVRLDDGTIVAADHIVSDAAIWNLYGTLIKPQHIRPERLSWARSFVPTFSVLLLYLGVDKEAIPDGTRPVEVFVADWHDLSSPNVIVYIPSLDDRSICPPDVHSLTVAVPAQRHDWPRAHDPLYRSAEYYERKQREADKVLDLLETRFPGLRDHIRVMEAATPSTVERFTLRPEGCVGGPKQMMGQELMRRPRARCEFKHLYLCGDSTVMGEGVVAVTSSGIGAANMILHDRMLTPYRPRRHRREFVHILKGTQRPPLPRAGEPVSTANAPRLATECQLCEDPGCKKHCPAEVDVLNFVRRIEAGNYVGAARAVREMNPFAEICGAICPSERLCERHCNRLEFSDSATRIRELHGLAAAQAGDRGWDRRIAPQKHKTIAVVGAGPAGLTCGFFLARLGYLVDIYEKGEKTGRHDVLRHTAFSPAGCAPRAGTRGGETAHYEVHFRDIAWHRRHDRGPGVEVRRRFSSARPVEEPASPCARLGRRTAH